MYFYCPCDYGTEYFILAEDKIKSHEYLIKRLEDDLLKEIEYEKGNNVSCSDYVLNMWKDVNPLDEKTFPYKYKLIEYGVGSVIITERC